MGGVTDYSIGLIARYLLPQIVATARSLPRLPTTIQTKPTVKNTTIGMNVPNCDSLTAAKADMDDRTKNNPPTTRNITLINAKVCMLKYFKLPEYAFLIN